MKKTLLDTLVLFTLFFNCKNDKNLQQLDLELEILTDSLIAYCKDGDCSNALRYYSETQDLSRNLVEFKITNKTNITYAFIPICDDFASIGCSIFDAFPDKYANLDHNTVVIKNEDTNTIIEFSYPLVNYFPTDNDIYESVKDSIETNYYKKIGLEGKSWDWKMMNRKITNKMIIIHPNETLFFNSFITLPNNTDVTNKNLQKMNLDFNKNYSAQLYFISNIDSIQNYLTKSQKATFEANSYVHYKKPLVSINSIPIKFKK